ncbi:MAG TPA: agmatine deiminase family protein [Bryobacteraceae bacterium]|nr:agmatine deiminase family protein [Bryobacteraceae bacterium]
MQTMEEFRMPAEWERHEATWLAWPHEITDWPGKFETIQWVYGEIVRHLSRMEKVRILIQDSELDQQVITNVLTECGAHMAAVEFFHQPTDRSWTRDFCPMFVRDMRGRRVLLNWQFNGWAKYDNWQLDDAVTASLAPQLDLPMHTPERDGRRLVLEGGSIDVNGAGSILTTEECLLSDVQARNPGLSRTDMEAVFHRYLGARNTLWLRNGIAGDDTHGHVDDLARFTDAHTIVVAAESDPSEANYEPLKENLALLREMRDQDGLALHIETLPMPEPVFFDGQRLPASYANFYIANGLVLAPTFNDANDRVALNTLARLFPDRKVAGIAATDLVLGLGTLHCMTQQQPA